MVIKQKQEKKVKTRHDGKKNEGSWHIWKAWNMLLNWPVRELARQLEFEENAKKDSIS